MLLASTDKTRKQLEHINGLTLDYVTALRDIGAQQTLILSLFKKLDEAEIYWTRAFHQLVNSDAFALMPNVTLVETLINEAGSAFKDARTATWRYFVLSEPSQVARITGAADQAVEKLTYARRDVRDPKVIEGIEQLRQIVPEYVGTLKTITGAINSQIEIQRDRASGAENTARQLLDDVARTATEFSDQATRDAIAGARQAEKLRIGLGAIMTILFLGIALFASRAIGRPIQQSAACCSNLRAAGPMSAFPMSIVATKLATPPAPRACSRTICCTWRGSRPGKRPPRPAPARLASRKCCVWPTHSRNRLARSSIRCRRRRRSSRPPLSP